MDVSSSETGKLERVQVWKKDKFFFAHVFEILEEHLSVGV